jgi:N-acetylglucosamine malate deacetylase 1
MRIAVVVAHADDEILGCGGTMAKHSACGDTIHVVYMTPKITVRESDGEKLDQERRKALAIVGNGNITFTVLKFADQMLDTVGQSVLAKAIESELIPYNPDIIYTHSVYDRNEDHRETARAVTTAARPCALDPSAILSFEVLSSTEWGDGFIPDYWEHIGIFMQQKCKAIKAYRSELRKWPHPRSVKGVQNLAEYRGMQICRDYAEAFKTIRRVGKCH